MKTRTLSCTFYQLSLANTVKIPQLLKEIKQIVINRVPSTVQEIKQHENLGNAIAED